jgi:putative tricarboxylic transport membrane protein
MSNEPGAPAGESPRGFVKASREFGAGLFLVALGAIGYFGSYSLKFGQLSGIGPGLMPKVTAILVAFFGLLLMVQSVTSVGERLESWAVRGPLFVLAAVVAFALTVRPCGLLVAGPLAVIISALADKETGPVEIAIFALVMTTLCGLLFKDMLALPIPFDPLGLIPDPVALAYAGFKKSFVATVFGLFK